MVGTFIGKIDYLKRMYKVKITVEGPGGTIGFEVETIVKALTEAGFKIEVKDNHPIDLSRQTAEEFLIRTREHYETGYLVRPEIIIQTVHLPWGG